MKEFFVHILLCSFITFWWLFCYSGTHRSSAQSPKMKIRRTKLVTRRWVRQKSQPELLMTSWKAMKWTRNCLKVSSVHNAGCILTQYVHYGTSLMFTEQKFEYPDRDRSRPAVPKQTEKPLLGLKTTKDFIKQNAVENIMSVPKAPTKNYVDTRNGARHALQPSGLEPVHLRRKVRRMSYSSSSGSGLCS